jgi:hypothetical protein
MQIARHQDVMLVVLRSKVSNVLEKCDELRYAKLPEHHLNRL